MSEAKFIGGLIVKAPNERAPEYVKARLSIKRDELIAWLQTERGEWINADIKVSNGGKWYASVDDWKPQEGHQATTRGGAPTRNAPRPTQRQAPATQRGDYDDFDDAGIPFIRQQAHF